MNVVNQPLLVNAVTGNIVIAGSNIQVPVQLQSSLITLPVTGTVGVLGTANVNIAGSSITVPVQGGVTVQPSTTNLLSAYNVVYPASTAYIVSAMTPAPGKLTIDFVAVNAGPTVQLQRCYGTNCTAAYINGGQAVATGVWYSFLVGANTGETYSLVINTTSTMTIIMNYLPF